MFVARRAVAPVAALFVAALLPPGLAAEAAEYRFAAPDEARAALTAEDAYTQALQPAELAVRLADPDGAKADLLARYADGVRAWSADERTQLEGTIADLADDVAFLDPLLPDVVLLVRADPSVEGGLPHTRGNAIVFPTETLPEKGLKGLFLHELHHVLTRANPDLQDPYFALIGFEPCAFAEPEWLRERRLSNPDAPTNAHYAPLDLERGDGVMPVLHLSAPYDPEKGGGLGDYFAFGLLHVAAVDGRCEALETGDGGLLVTAPAATPGFLDAVGRNTGYLIHPEETLADNFTFGVLETGELPDPEIPARVMAFWRSRAAAARTSAQ